MLLLGAQAPLPGPLPCLTGCSTEAVCGGVGRDKVTVANGNHAIPGRGHRVGVTSDGAENAPRLRVANGEDSKESDHQ